MIIETLTLKQFRNYENVQVQFTPGINMILGLNGAGKTNLVEAIYYLSFARSFRTWEARDLISQDKDGALIEANILQGDQKKNIKIIITEKGQKVMINRQEITRLSELLNAVNVIVFEPKDVNFFQSLPRLRRNFLNMQLSKLSRKYLESCSACTKLTKDRNAILKELNVNFDLLNVVTNQLIEYSYDIVTKRQEFIKNLEQLVNRILKEISNLQLEISFKYESFVEFETKEDYLANAKKKFKDSLEEDLKRKSSTVGIHHEDFSTWLDNAKLGTYGSQGQKRMCAIALKLAPYFLQQEKEKRPIVVLDDVLSELDDEHKDRLMKFLEKFNQVFITGTNIKENYNITIYDVENHKVSRRNTHGF